MSAQTTQRQRHPALYPTPPTSSSETELDSPLDDDIEEYDYPVSPTDPTMDETHSHPSASPSPSVRLSGVGVSRAPSNSSFFNAVFLDTPDRHLTRPLKVKKRVAPVGPSRIRRRSIHSMPQSPISPVHQSYLQIPPSPRHPNLTREASTSSSAHRAITDSFFALDSPITSTPLPPIPSIADMVPTSRSSSASSANHLGLGRFAAFDPTIAPLPSPPSSPPATPHLSSALLAETPPSPTLLTPPPRRTGSSKPIPPTPVTPSNAPSKAARLLGTNSPLPSALKPSPAHKSLAGLIRSAGPKRVPQHFRPLPHSTLGDIQRFFGDVPKKSQVPVKRTNPKSTEARGKATAASMAMMGKDKALPVIGSGGEREGEGRMWSDVEEEQEFAWLMSDHPAHLSSEQRAKAGGAAGEEEWGMEDFKCVLDMPAQPPHTSEKKPKAPKGKKEKAGPKVFESFLDLGLDDSTPIPSHPAPILPVALMRISAEEARPMANRSISNPVLISTSSPLTPLVRPSRPSRPSRSADGALAPPFAAARSVSAPFNTAMTGLPLPPLPAKSGSPRPTHSPRPTASPRPTPTSTATAPDSPQRPKHRPPPLDLRYLPPVRNLPIIAISLFPSLLPVGTSAPAKPLPTLLAALPILTPRSYSQHIKSKSLDSPGLPAVFPARPAPVDVPLSTGMDDEDDDVFSSGLVVSYGQPRRSKAVAILGVKVAMAVVADQRVGVGMELPKTPFGHPRRAPLPNSTGQIGLGRRSEEGPKVEGYRSYEKTMEMDMEAGEGFGQVSVFDPPSPTVQASGMGAWFKRRAGRM